MDRDIKRTYEIIQALKNDESIKYKPPIDIAPSNGQLIIPLALVKGTRGYLVKIVHQINGCYESGWHDACAVMIRRLIEILIIEVYENNKMIDKIIDKGTGYPFFLDTLINIILSDTTWIIGRATKRGLPKIKTLGDKSAHNRRYNAISDDIEKVADDLRDCLDELLHLAHLK
jgi:hypothetical protein